MAYEIEGGNVNGRRN